LAKNRHRQLAEKIPGWKNGQKVHKNGWKNGQKYAFEGCKNGHAVA